MTRADIEKTIADEFYKLADLFNQLGAVDAAGPARPAGQVAAASAAPASTFSDGTPIDEAEQWEEFSAAPLPATAEPTGPQGFDAICPAHRKEYVEGRYGLFCTQSSDDPSPDWTNPKGYCRVTPKNAAKWLRQHAGVAA